MMTDSIPVPGDVPKCKYKVKLIAIGMTAGLLLAAAVAGWTLVLYCWRMHRRQTHKQNGVDQRRRVCV